MLLEVKDLNISLASGKCVAEHISFQLDQGEMLSIVGSSGAGKTTICKAIMGLLGNTYRADGEILFQGSGPNWEARSAAICFNTVSRPI